MINLYRERRNAPDSDASGRRLIACDAIKPLPGKRQWPFVTPAQRQKFNRHRAYVASSPNDVADTARLWGEIDADGDIQWITETIDESGLFEEYTEPLFNNQTDAIRHAIFADDESIGLPPICDNKETWRIWIDEAIRRAKSTDALLEVLEIEKIEDRLAFDGAQSELESLKNAWRDQESRREHGLSVSGDAGNGVGDGPADPVDAGIDPGSTSSAEPIREVRTADTAGTPDVRDVERHSQRPAESWGLVSRRGEIEAWEIDPASLPTSIEDRVAGNIAAIERLLDTSPLQAKDQDILSGYTGWRGLNACFAEPHDADYNDISKDTRAHLDDLRSRLTIDLWIRFEQISESILPDTVHNEAQELVRQLAEQLDIPEHKHVNCNEDSGDPAARIIREAQLGSQVMHLALDEESNASSPGGVAAVLIDEGNTFGDPETLGQRHTPNTLGALARCIRETQDGDISVVCLPTKYGWDRYIGFRRILHDMADFCGSVVVDIGTGEKLETEPEEAEHQAGKETETKAETGQTEEKSEEETEEQPEEEKENKESVMLAVFRRRETGTPNIETQTATRFPESFKYSLKAGFRKIQDDITEAIAAENISEQVLNPDEHQNTENSDSSEAEENAAASAIVPRISQRDQKRRESLIALGESAKALLQMEQEDTPSVDIARARDALNAQLNTHLKRYRDARGIGSARSARLLADYPDQHLILSLHSVQNGVEHRSGLLSQRQLFPPPEHIQPLSANDVASLSMMKYGHLDFAWCAQRTGTTMRALKRALIANGTAFLDPHTQSVVHRDDYLSGDILSKIASAKGAIANGKDEFQANLIALEQVRPARIPYKDISAQIGSAWIPEKIYSDFMSDVLEMPILVKQAEESENLTVRVDWKSEQYNSQARRDVSDNLNNITYGTRRMDAMEIMEKLLNNRSIQLRKKVRVWDATKGQYIERSVIDRPATMSARERADMLKARFEEWLWDKPERRQAMEDKYNDIHSRYVYRTYDGSDMKMSGVGENITFRQNQSNVALRIMSSKRTMVDHVVGAGKTYAAILGAKASWEAGEAKKTLFCVPNHLLLQWGRAIHELEPMAKVLTVTPEMLAPKNLHLTEQRMAKDWQAVIYPHSAVVKLERMDNIGIEGQGFDMLVLDESHHFKSIPLDTNRGMVPGVPSKDGSISGAAMLSLIRRMEAKHLNAKLVFLSGTPIANSMSELYVIEKYMNPEALIRRGESSFDRWLCTYADITEDIEVDDVGMGFVSRERLRGIRNVPELSAAYGAFSDVTLAEDMNEIIREESGVPAIKGEKAEMVIVQPTRALKDTLDDLVYRLEQVSKNPGRQENAVQANPDDNDNILKVINDGRHLALSRRTRYWSSGAEEGEKEKVDVCADRVHALWQKWAGDRGTQLVFCDLSTPKGKITDAEYAEEADPTEAPEKYSIYAHLKRNLVKLGVPAEEIAFIHDANTPAQRQALFDRCNAGDVRILIGSTAKMGTGVNVQDRLVALHHLDAPWRPSDMAQRDGRILRSGNQFLAKDPDFKVEILRYATKCTTDAKLWQALEVKQRTIDDLRAGRSLDRTVDDMSGTVAISYEEMKAIAAGDENMQRLAELSLRSNLLNSRAREHRMRCEEHLDSAKQMALQIKNQNRLLEEIDADAAQYTAPKAGNEESFKQSFANRIEDVRKGRIEPDEYSPLGYKNTWSLGTLAGLPLKLSSQETSLSNPKENGEVPLTMTRFALWIKGENDRMTWQHPNMFGNLEHLQRLGVSVHKQMASWGDPKEIEKQKEKVKNLTSEMARSRRRSQREAERQFPQAAEKTEVENEIREIRKAMEDKAYGQTQQNNTENPENAENIENTEDEVHRVNHGPAMNAA